jgi:HEAT repeat protein
VPALARGLQNEDASVRSNAALALYVLSDKSLSSDRVTPRVDIRAALPALIVALGSDSRTGRSRHKPSATSVLSRVLDLRPRARCLSSSAPLPIQAMTCEASRGWR